MNLFISLFIHLKWGLKAQTQCRRLAFQEAVSSYDHGLIVIYKGG